MNTKKLTAILAPAAFALVTAQAYAGDWVRHNSETYGEPAAPHALGIQAPAERMMQEHHDARFANGETYPAVHRVFEAQETGTVRSAVLTPRQLQRLYLN